MLADDLLVVGQVHAKQFVRRDERLNPLNAVKGTERPVRLIGGLAEALRRVFSHAGDLTFDDVPFHDASSLRSKMHPRALAREWQMCHST